MLSIYLCSVKGTELVRQTNKERTNFTKILLSFSSSKSSHLCNIKIN